MDCVLCCVVSSELSSKLQDTLEMIEEQLDVALSKTCSGFDVAHYEKVQSAYRLLGKTQVSGWCDGIGRHFLHYMFNFSCLPVYLFTCQLVCLVHLFVCLFVSLAVCLLVCLSVCLAVRRILRSVWQMFSICSVMAHSSQGIVGKVDGQFLHTRW